MRDTGNIFENNDALWFLEPFSVSSFSARPCQVYRKSKFLHKKVSQNKIKGKNPPPPSLEHSRIFFQNSVAHKRVFFFFF